jgi:glycosyltransferase involved in cell wall biosynthesis
MRIVVVQAHWGKRSNRFLARHLEMLRRRGMLAAIGVLYPTARRRWRNIPVVSLSDPDPITGPLRWMLRGGLRRLGLAPRVLRRQPARALGRLLDEVRSDAVLCQYATTAVAVEDALTGTSARVFVHLHGFDTVEAMCPEGHRAAMVDLSRRALVICNSEVTRRRMLEWGIRESRTVVKYPGVEVPDGPPDRRPVRESVILQLGRLIEVKGPDRTIKAFDLACGQGLKGRLVVAGDGRLRSRCEELRARSPHRDRIRLVGEVSWKTADRLRADAHIYTQHNTRDPSTGQIEAFGVTVIEAMAAGLPVVATRSGGVTESVVHDETGILVEPEDVEAQAESLLRLEQDPERRQSMGRAGLERVRESFSVEVEEARLLEILSGG